MKIAICPGHYTAAKGAVNHTYNINEHDEAIKVVDELSDILLTKGHEVKIISGKLSEKISLINSEHFDVALDIHFNAGGGRGCEVIHTPSSGVRMRQAEEMSLTISTFLNTKNRGAKDGWYRMDVPGQVDFPGDVDGDEHKDAFTAQTNCPAFIPEPLFIDCDEDAKYWLVGGRHRIIADAIAHGIMSAMKGEV